MKRPAAGQERRGEGKNLNQKGTKHMSRNPDTPFWIVAVVAVIVNLAWLGFVAWMIYKLVSWLVTK